MNNNSISSFCKRRKKKEEVTNGSFDGFVYILVSLLRKLDLMGRQTVS